MFKDKTARENIETLHSQVADRFNYQYGRMERLDEKLNLILDHLKLKYVPETEKKEPAKLVEKSKPTTTVYDVIDNWILPYADKELAKTKRKYTKQKKSKK